MRASSLRSKVCIGAIPFFILSPYLKFDEGYVNAGVISLLIIMVVNLKDLINRLLMRELLFFYAFALTLSAAYFISVLVNYPKDIDLLFIQFLAKDLIYVITGTVIASTFGRYIENDTDATCLIIAVIGITITLNSIIVISEFVSHDFRLWKEGFLFQDPTANIDYSSERLRMRGVASSGGANLSILNAVGVICVIFLISNNRIGLFFGLICTAPLFIALLFIGRTGLILLIPAISVMFLSALITHQSKISVWWVVIAGAPIILLLLLPILAKAMMTKGAYQYAIGFLVGGAEALSREGSLDVLGKWYVTPSALESMFGAGDFSGGLGGVLFADPGILKMVSAVGVPFAVIFYLAVGIYTVGMSARASTLVKSSDALLLSMLAILLVAEFKEPALLKGYSARVFWMLIGFFAALVAARSRLSHETKNV